MEVLVWRHTGVGCVRNRTLEGQRWGNTSESASRSQDDLEVDYSDREPGNRDWYPQKYYFKLYKAIMDWAIV